MKQRKPFDEDKIRSILRKIDQQRIEIREKQANAPVEITNPSPGQLIEQLNQGVCTIFFYKISDGNHRKMKCTQKDHVPVRSRFNKTGVLVVWDLDHNNWRSFYADRVYKLVRNEQTDAQ